MYEKDFDNFYIVYDIVGEDSFVFDKDFIF